MSTYLVIQKSTVSPDTAHAYIVDARDGEDASELIENHPFGGAIILGRVSESGDTCFFVYDEITKKGKI